MEVAAAENVTVKVISGHRTFEEQDKLYAQGRTTPGKIVTNARGGYSNHNFGIAIDFGVFRGAAYLDNSAPATARKVHQLIAAAAKKADLATDWGGDWSKPDHPHHEVRTGMTTTQKRNAYMKNGTVFD